jgi:hypothetical protein
LAAAMWFLVPATSIAQTSGDPDPLFQSQDILDVRIVAPISTILSVRSDEEEVDGKFQYTDEAGELVEWDIGIRTRGLFRRDRSVCPFPPLRLNFKSSQIKKSLFHKQDKLKMVTHCRDDSSRYEQTVLREYVAYRFLNELTDVSFRVRLLRVTYTDTDGRDSDRTRYGFLIEHKDRLAKRLGLAPVEIKSTKVSALQPGYMNLVSMFHYMIGNTDFSPIAGAEAECCHNHELLGAEGELLYSVPYDFDQSGLVDAPHGVTNPRFKLKNARQRLYRGRCANNEHLDETIALYSGKRDALLQLAGEQEGTEDKARKAMTSYLTKFFKTIDSPKQVQKKLVKKCI